MQRNAALANESMLSEKEIKARNDEITRLRTEIGLWERKLEREQKTSERYKGLFSESKTPLKMAQVQISALEKEIESLRRAAEKHRKEKEGVERERGVQMTATQKAMEETKLREESILERDRILESVESELASYKVQQLAGDQMTH
jgi:hypothetical protein